MSFSVTSFSFIRFSLLARCMCSISLNAKVRRHFASHVSLSALQRSPRQELNLHRNRKLVRAAQWKAADTGSRFKPLAFLLPLSAWISRELSSPLKTFVWRNVWRSSVGLTLLFVGLSFLWRHEWKLVCIDQSGTALTLKHSEDRSTRLLTSCCY